ncbi:MAG: AraC family transcriptional regulator [Rikenellaceae bacterium]
MTEINNQHELLANIGKFDVWFRFTIFIYPIFIIVKLLYDKKKYEQWCKENYSNSEYINLTWINYYIFGYFILLCSYLVLIIGHNIQNMLMHNLCFIIFFGYCLNGVIHQAIPPTDDDTEDNILDLDQQTTFSDDTLPYESYDSYDKYRFVDMVPQYKITLEQWMIKDKPYRNKDFKLIDVMKVLPLNRSYISRMFNDTYGETFLDFVMRYRIDDSTNILLTHPDMTIAHIAQICGFSSPSVFGRAFLKINGVTPKQYRDLHLKNIESIVVNS